MEVNPLGLDGIEFLEFCGPDARDLELKFRQFGMVETAKHNSRNIKLFRQNDIHFLINDEPNSFATEFYRMHGPAACGMGLRVKNAKRAFETAVARGARPYIGGTKSGWSLPAIYGIGDSLVYFVDHYTPSPHGQPMMDRGNIYGEFKFVNEDHYPRGKGLIEVDHLTNNVPKGEMQKWCDFYEKVFNFKEKRYFDIRGKSTGLISKVMKSPCGKFSIPINEPTDGAGKSQIQEYLDEYKGSGIQHVAFLSENILQDVKGLSEAGVKFLERPIATYYEALPKRLPNVKETVAQLSEVAVLADGDSEGYLLQIFTQNQFGPIFIEIIQRCGHDGFGDGNFQALFDAMEEDQRRRGVI